MRPNRAGPAPGAREFLALALIALIAASYLAYRAADFIQGGCDCAGGGGTTAAGVVRAAALIIGALVLYAIAAAAAWRAARPHRRP